MTKRAILVAGTVSGVGKTTIATGLMGALKRRGLRVQPFKTGPDYIDPTYHTSVTGEVSRNLDTWMLDGDTVIELFNRASAGKDIAVIEGVMGLYDGRSATSGEGSTGELARLLGVPVILVVDSRKGARSLAAMVLGYRDFDPALRLAGVILNGTGSDRHYQLCREAVEHYTGVPVVGYLPRNEHLALPERHLGLVPIVEGEVAEETLENLITQCEATLDVSGILTIAERFSPQLAVAGSFPASPVTSQVRIAVARDRAFSFYYQDSLDLLEAWGAELVPFSPIEDEDLPPDTAGVYLGGGFPELYAAELAANTAMRQALKTKGGEGMPIYAECGGLMYAAEGIITFDGSRHAMTGLLPGWAEMQGQRVAMGYAEAETLRPNLLADKGTILRGHLFHWSKMPPPGPGSAYRILPPREQFEGLIGGPRGNVLGSYFHVHFGSKPSLAKRFIASCAYWRYARTAGTI